MSKMTQIEINRIKALVLKEKACFESVFIQYGQPSSFDDKVCVKFFNNTVNIWLGDLYYEINIVDFRKWSVAVAATKEVFLKSNSDAFKKAHWSEVLLRDDNGEYRIDQKTFWKNSSEPMYEIDTDSFSWSQIVDGSKFKEFSLTSDLGNWRKII